ncbi:MAG: beta-lactamase family protein [Chloroflexi bacterium]|nr:beta-lactamase family protein [Chloroflexota bacterium]
MRRQKMSEKVDAIFAAYQEDGSPGCAVAVVKDGEIIFKRGYGLANVEHSIPNSPATVFNIGSESKQFTAMAILLLANRGKLSLDNDIRLHLPEAPDFGVTITIRHLIHHTSGIRCSFPPLLMVGGWMEGDKTTKEDVYRLFLAQRELNFKPGAEHSYANMGYIVLANIVERVSEQSFAAFCREHIFQPLEMANTVVQDSPFLIVPNRAQSYWRDDNGRLFYAPLPDGVVGPTNVYTSVEDLALWDENFYSGQMGGKQLVAQMLQRGQLNNGTILDYACGVVHGAQHRGLTTIEHGGGHGGYVSALIRFPDLHLSTIVLCNVFSWQARQYALQMADIFLDNLLMQKVGSGQEAIEKPELPPAVVLSNEQISSKAGMYFHRKRVALREVNLKDGNLQLSGVDLLPINDETFLFAESPDVQIIFNLDQDDLPVQMRIKTSSTDFSYERVESAKLTLVELQQYEGVYCCPELNVYWQIVLENEQLVVKHQRVADTQLTAVFTDGFKNDWTAAAGFPYSFFVIFDRDEDGTISGFGISDDRMRNLKFYRMIR